MWAGSVPRGITWGLSQDCGQTGNALTHVGSEEVWLEDRDHPHPPLLCVATLSFFSW